MDKQTLSAVLNEILTKRDLVEKKFLETETANQQYTYVLGQLDVVNDVYDSVMMMLFEVHD